MQLSIDHYSESLKGNTLLTLSPPTCTHSGIMQLLGALLVAQTDSLATRLADYTGKLVARPNQLADFVAYVEVREWTTSSVKLCRCAGT